MALLEATGERMPRIKRSPLPINQTWQHDLEPDALLDALLSFGDAALKLGVLRQPTVDSVMLTVAFENISGTLVDIRAAIRPRHVRSLQSGTFRLLETSLKPGSVLRGDAGSVLLNVNVAQRNVALAIQNAPDVSKVRKLLDFAKSTFPQPIQRPDVQVRQPSADPKPRPAISRGQAGPQPGQRVDHYQLVKRLGSGASGEVWQASVVEPPDGVPVSAGEIVAMKQYFPFGRMQAADSLRIQREFQVASYVRHENLVSVYDLVISPNRPLGSFLIMEYVAGTTLKAKIPRGGMSLPECIAIGTQLASALSDLHAYGALHRDIKPANIMVLPGEHPTIKLLDLGIVSVVTEKGLTETSVFLGSKHTAAPEQLYGQELDARTDLYALGATLCHCHRGNPLYESVGPAPAIVKRMLQDPERHVARRGASDQEHAFVDFVNRCISQEPSERPPDASTCLAFLDSIAKLDA